MRITILLFSILFYDLVKTFKPSDLRDAEKYLAEFYDHDIENGSIEESLKKFQTFAGIESNGFLSDEVIAHMNKPRCGVKDAVKKTKRYTVFDKKWDSGVTYKYYLHEDWLPRTMSEAEIRRVIKVALDYWSKVSNIAFQESRSTTGCKFSLSFVGRFHNIYNVDDNFRTRRDPNSIDNVPNGVLAHAYPPFVGNLHMDNAETWTEGTEDGINLRLIVAHEMGHAIGLGHSDDFTALMAPFYTGYISEEQFKLSPDDIRGAQSLFGARGKRSPLKGLKKTGKIQSKFCQAKNIDSIFKFSDERFYIIADGHLFRLNGTQIDETFQPKKAVKYLKNVDSMFYDNKGKRLIIFKGQSVSSVFGKDIHNVQMKPLNITGHGAYLGKSSAAFIREESEDKDLQYFWIIQDQKVISGELWKNKVVFGRRTQKLSDILEMSNGAKLPKSIDAAILTGEKSKLKLYIFVQNSYYVGLPKGRKQSKYFIPAQYPKSYKKHFKC